MSSAATEQNLKPGAPGQQAHYPFGELWYPQSPTTKWLFTTYERDPESANDYAMARSYVNRLGRFNSGDRIAGSIADPQTLNRYAYTRNDSVSLIDPLGLTTQCWRDGQSVDCSTIGIMANEGPGDEGIIAGGLFGCNDEYGDTVCSVTGLFQFVRIFGGGPSPCIQPTRIQRFGIAIQAAAAKFWNKTLLAGLGGSAGVGFGKGIGIYGSAAVQIAVSPSGSAAYVITFAVPATGTSQGTYAWLTPSTKGFGALGGAQFGFSNVTDPSQLSGKGVDISGSLAAFLGIGGDISFGSSTYEVNVTLGFGAGGRGGAGAVTNTLVIPICP
jgi:RHS repeat-associated protein